MLSTVQRIEAEWRRREADLLAAIRDAEDEEHEAELRDDLAHLRAEIRTTGRAAVLAAMAELYAA